MMMFYYSVLSTEQNENCRFVHIHCSNDSLHEIVCMCVCDKAILQRAF